MSRTQKILVADSGSTGGCARLHRTWELALKGAIWLLFY